MRLLLLASITGSLLVLSACDTSTPDTASALTTSSDVGLTAHREAGASSLALIRRATAPYHRVSRALDAGYAPASPCVAATTEDGTEVAAMGIHYVNFGLIDGTIDPSAPEILLYEPAKNGTLRLVGVEFMVAAPAWTSDEPPTLQGVEFDAHLTPETMHGIPVPHYDLHAWTWKNNPDGMHMPMNPTVSCAHAE